MTQQDLDLDFNLRLGAVMSPGGLYRYHLWRRWGPGSCVLWVMLNPSKADHRADDPTIRKCVGFANRWGYHGIEVVNLFALIATDCRELRRHADPVGPGNPAALRNLLRDRGDSRLIVAWGAGAKVGGRIVANRARRFREEVGHLPFACLGTTQDGQPRHPLMLAYDTPIEPWPVRP